MNPQEAVNLLNDENHTTFSLSPQLSGGGNQGGYLVTSTDGARAVLKTSRNPLWISQVQRAKSATNLLLTLNYPVPTYKYVGSTTQGTYWLLNELPGAVITNPTVEQTAAILELIERQKGQMISEVQGQDWVWYLMDVIFRGASGNVRNLMQFSPETSALAAHIEGMVAGMEATVIPKTDLVHGDFSIDQILSSEDEEITGVLSWDQVGYGDRTIDVVGLWFSVLNFPMPRELVMKRLLEISTPEVIKILAAGKMLATVAWNINTVGGNVTKVVAQAHMALDFLSQL